MKTAVRDAAVVEAIRDPRYGAIRELAGTMTGLPDLGLAWAEVDIGATSPLHFHRRMSEAYFILEGTAEMRLDDECFAMTPGQAVSIPPGTLHAIANSGSTVLRLLVATSPSYDEDDDIEVDILG